MIIIGLLGFLLIAVILEWLWWEYEPWDVKEELNMFNRWKAYPKRKPTTDGFYLCTIGLKGGEYVMRLWYNARFDTWSDKPRQKIFDWYAVFYSAKRTDEAGRLCTDELCDRTKEVIGWKKLPRPFVKF